MLETIVVSKRFGMLDRLVGVCVLGKRKMVRN